MSDIKKIRENINQIDKEIAKLFEERMKQSKEVANYKIKQALPIEDLNREKEVIAKNVNLIEDSEIKDYYVDFMHSVMDISKKYQYRLVEGMKIAYCGVEGAFAYIASKKIFNSQKLVSYPSFTAAYNAVVDGTCDACVLPLENSYAGDVGEVMDLLFSGSLFINNVINVEIVHNLIGINGSSIDKIKTVLSHPQALEQCHKYIQTHNFKTLEYPNTAIAAKELASFNDETMAVIASKDVADLYNLSILESNINESRNNTTRFAVFTKNINTEKSPSKMGQHFILVFTVLNEAGALAKPLNIIGAHGFNMRTLRSRPMKELIWNYYFFVELEGDINSADGQDMLTQLRSVCDCLKIVGTYNSITKDK